MAYIWNLYEIFMEPYKEFRPIEPGDTDLRGASVPTAG